MHEMQDNRPDDQDALDPEGVPAAGPEVNHERSTTPHNAGPSGVYVVRERPSGGGSKLLPPLLILLAAFGILAYRSNSADWRGITALFDRHAPSPSLFPAEASKPAPDQVAKVEAPAPAEKEIVTPSDIVKAAEIKPAGDAPKAQTPPVVVAEEKKDDKPIAEVPAPVAEKAETIDDIKREAEKTREKLAELEKQKALEAKKLEDTAGAREQADRRARRNDIDQQIAAMQQLMARQMAEFQRMAGADMEEMQRNFLGGRAAGGRPFPFPRGFMGIPDLEKRMLRDFPGMIPAPPEPGIPGAGGNKGAGKAAQNGKERVIRDGRGGITRIREYVGANGMVIREMHFQSGNLAGGDDKADSDDDPPPPPPRPAFPRGPQQPNRRFD